MRRNNDINKIYQVIITPTTTAPGILFSTWEESTILSHVPTFKFVMDGDLYKLHSHSSRRPSWFIYPSEHLNVSL